MKFRCPYCLTEADADLPIARCPRCREIAPVEISLFCVETKTGGMATALAAQKLPHKRAIIINALFGR